MLWRDHDMMWSSEPGSGKYGAFPYPHTVRPANSPYIQYLTLHDEARRRTLQWVAGLRHLEVLPNTFHYEAPADPGRGTAFRRHFGIPAEAALIARYTRIIPQKRIDRDIDLTARLHALFGERGVNRPLYLFVAGDPDECPAETRALRALARDAGIAEHVVFGGRLAPHWAESESSCRTSFATAGSSNHLSDDWDFGILVRAWGEEISYVPRSRVEINPRRVDHAIDEVITGRAYGNGGIITMRDIRPPRVDPDRDLDLTEA